MDKLIERINPKWISLIETDKPYFSTVDEEDRLHRLKEARKKGLTMYPLSVCFISQNSVSTLIRNFIQQYFQKPIFSNCAILENTTNESNESLQLLFSLMPFEYIVSGSKKPLFDFIIEHSLENYGGQRSENLFGFYYDVESRDEGYPVILYDHVTPFLINNQVVEILPKSETMKTCVSQIIERRKHKTRLRALFISGNYSEISSSVIDSLIAKLHLKDEAEALIDKFGNNYIITKTQNREIFDNQLLIPLVYDDGNTSMTLNNVIIQFRFLDDYSQQKDFLKTVISRAVELIKRDVSDCVTAFNEDENKRDIFTNINRETDQKFTALKKERPNREYNHFKISPRYDTLFKHICSTNDIDYGSHVLITPKGVRLSDTELKKQLDDFEKQFCKVIDSFFADDIKKIT